MDIANVAEFLTFFDWKEVLLQTRDMERPDGRPLYKYRINESEFHSLEDFLRKKIEELHVLNDFAYIAERPGFADLFVLYGAEWWRRSYDGHGFMWEPILADLQVDSSEWTPSDRSDCVRNGLRGWGLDLLRTGGHRYLGAVAVQGGLPMKLLAEARGRVSHVLSRVLQLSRNSSVLRQDLYGWLVSLQTLLPMVYRQTEIYNLLADIAWTVLELKQKANLRSGTDAIARLDSILPKWREEFPLPIEDDQARALIEQLVREAATVRVERQTLSLPLERSLASDENGGWILRSNIDLPDSIKSDRLASLFEINVDDLPRTAELCLFVGETGRIAQIRKMPGHDEYRISRTPWGFSGPDATNEHILRLNAPDGRMWSVTATKGQPLEDELPWVFSADETGRALLRQGGGNVPATEALLAVPERWEVMPQTDAELIGFGKLEVPGRSLYRFRGTVAASDSTGAVYRVRSGHAGATDITYEWRGFRYWLDFQSPTIAFRGTPTLYEVDEDGNKRKASGNVGCAVVGSPGSSASLGPVYLRYPTTGEIKHRTRMVLLPDDANLTITPGDASSGSINFSGWNISDVRVLTPNIASASSTNGSAYRLNLSVTPGFRTPDRIEIEACWRHTITPARLVLPFPAKGVRAFDGSGRELHSGEHIAIQNVLGVRFVVLGGQPNATAVLGLKSSNGKAARKHRIRPSAGAISFEIRISDYLSDIQHLLSIDDSPDAAVKVTIDLGTDEPFTIEIARYAAKIDRAGSNALVSRSNLGDLKEEDLDKILVQAIRLENPGDEPITLLRVDSEDDSYLAWDFSPETREPGSWLLYPPPDALLNFRPTLWHVAGEVSDVNAIAKAISLADQDERNAAFDKVVEDLSEDYQDPSWVEVEQLGSQIGHLPLATLDIWRRFARSASGMSALAFRVGNLSPEFVGRFSQEMPFAWETVPFCVWKRSMRLLKKQCSILFGDDNGEKMIRLFLDPKIKDLSAEHAALAFALGIASAECIPENSQQVLGLRMFVDQDVTRLFHGEDSHLMNLRRNHADDIWPEEFKSILSDARRDPVLSQFLYTDEFHARNCVINLPLLIATQVATNKSAEWLADPARIQLMRAYRAFDPDWFDEAYNITITRCLAAGLLDS